MASPDVEGHDKVFVRAALWIQQQHLVYDSQSGTLLLKHFHSDKMEKHVSQGVDGFEAFREAAALLLLKICIWIVTDIAIPGHL